MSQLWCFRITGELFALTKEMEHVHQRLKSQEVTWAPNMAIYFTYILHFWPDTAVVFGHGKKSKNLRISKCSTYDQWHLIKDLTAKQ